MYSCERETIYVPVNVGIGTFVGTLYTPIVTEAIHEGCFNTTNRAPQCAISTSLTPTVCIPFQFTIAHQVSPFTSQ